MNEWTESGRLVLTIACNLKNHKETKMKQLQFLLSRRPAFTLLLTLIILITAACGPQSTDATTTPVKPTAVQDEQPVETVENKDTAVDQEALDLEGLNQDELNELLLEAVRSDDLALIERLLDAGADIETRTPLGLTVLMLAAYRNNFDMVKLFVDYGADVNVQSGSGPRYGDLRGSPLTMAAKFGSPEMVELLINSGADINTSTWADSGEACEALFAAAEVDKAEITELLLANGAIVDGTDPSGQSPLIHSAYFNSPDVINVLLANGANIDLQDVAGFTALHVAARDNNLEAYEFLMENGADMTIKTNMGQTAKELLTDKSVGK